MEQIQSINFKQTLLRNQTASYYEPTAFKFEGVNLSNEEIKVIKSTASCGCLTASYDKTIKPGEIFYVILLLNKVGVKGAFNQSVTLNYSNGQEIKLKVNGTIEQPNEES